MVERLNLHICIRANTLLYLTYEIQKVKKNVFKVIKSNSNNYATTKFQENDTKVYL